MSVWTTSRDQILVSHGEWGLEKQFTRFHVQNPHVYRELVFLARKWRERRPAEPCSIALLFEVVRWETALRTTGEPLKLNNNYRAFYARMIMERCPDLKGIFRIRRQQS